MRGSHRTGEFIDLFTRDFSGSDFQRLFTHDTREAYRFFSHHIDEAAFNELSLVKRLAVKTRLFFLAFTVKLSPARRALFGLALVAAFIGALQLFDGFGLIQTALPLFPFNIRIPRPVWADGTLWLLSGFVLINLLVLLEVADRLTLKNELEVARDIQLAMLPHHTYSADGVEAEGWTRPANTVGGDFYDVLPLRDGRLIVALGDVAGKGSPAALLMALLLAMLRTLVTEGLPPSRLVERLNQLVHQQTPGSRFITLFLGVFDPTSGELTYVNAGQTPPLLLSGDRADRLLTGGIALGMFEGAKYDVGRRTLEPGDVLVMYSDGITEAEDPGGKPFDESGLQSFAESVRARPIEEFGPEIFSAVARHTRTAKFADDLTVLVLRRLATVQSEDFLTLTGFRPIHPQDVAMGDPP